MRRRWLAPRAGFGMDADGGGGPSSFARDRGPVLWLVALGADEEVGVVPASLCCSTRSNSSTRRRLGRSSLDGACRRWIRKVREESLATMQFVPIVVARAHRKVVNGKQGVRW